MVTTAAAPSAGHGTDRPQPRHGRRASWVPRTSWQALATVVGLVLLSFTVVSSATRANPGVWYIDEWTYIDYLHKVHDGQLYMPPGDVVSQAAIRDTACRGLAHPGHRWLERPPCDQQEYDPSAFINGGINTAGIHPPTYFWVTDVAARGVMLTGATDDLVSAGRLAGAGWMAAGLIALLALMRELRVPAVARAIGLVVVAVTPAFVESWQYLTPDAANMLVGSLVVLAALRWARGRCPTWVLAAAGFGAMAVKFPNVMVVCLAACIVLVLPPAAVAWRRRLLAVVALGAAAVGTAVLSLAWGSLNARDGADESAIASKYDVPGFDPAWLLDNAELFLRPFARADTDGYQIGLYLAWAMVALLVVRGLGGPWRHPDAVLARVVLVVLLAGPGLLVLLTYVSQGQYFGVSGRYGHSLVPAAVAVVATTWRTTPWQVIAGIAVLPHVVISVMTWSSTTPV